MRKREIPQLVFATRSPAPRSGSDFVRQVVAESAGVSEEARREFSRRADIAGSVLQFRPRDPGQRLRLFIFHPLAEGTWLFARAFSLGLYRKGSHQLLVHGVVLDEEVLDGLEANPLALDALENLPELGFRFLDHHPGSRKDLAPLALTPAAFDHARRHNRQRLAEIPSDQDSWIAETYDALASGDRAACVTADPRPEDIERLLLHFHPDDRLEIGFNTFYSHSRQVDYRLVAVLPQDLSQARSHFRGIRPVDLTAPSPAAGGLGELVCKLRRSSLADFLNAVNQALLTQLSHRRRQPLSPADATLVLRASLYREPLSTTDGQRLDILFQRAGGGLAYLVSHLAVRWGKDPEGLRRALEAATRADEKISREQLERYVEEHLDAGTAAQRWALATLMTRPTAFAADAALSDQELLELWRRLLPRPLLEELEPHQLPMTEEILGRWALVHARAGDPTDDPPDWATALRWLGERKRPLPALAAKVENALAGRRHASEPPTWRRLGDLLRELGHADDARRVLLVREIPSLSAFEARRRTEPEVDRILDAGGGQLPDLAPHFERPGVAAATFGRLTEHVSRRPAARPWNDFRDCLVRAEKLDPGAAEDAGRLLAQIVRSSAVDDGYGGWFLDRCRRLPPIASHPAPFVAGALRAAAEGLVPVCEAVAGSTNKTEMVKATAMLLELRVRHPAAAGADVELMRSAVRGRVLAAANRGGDEKDAAARLDSIWGDFLRQAVSGPALDDPPSADALEWLDLLQDELFAQPPRGSGEDVALEIFFDLAWNLWGRQPPDSAVRHTLTFKLRWALQRQDAERPSWFPIKLAERFRPRSTRQQTVRHRERIRLRVPRRFWSEAEKLLRPPILRPTERGSPGESP